MRVSPPLRRGSPIVMADNAVHGAVRAATHSRRIRTRRASRIQRQRRPASVDRLHHRAAGIRLGRQRRPVRCAGDVVGPARRRGRALAHRGRSGRTGPMASRRSGPRLTPQRAGARTRRCLRRVRPDQVGRARRRLRRHCPRRGAIRQWRWTIEQRAERRPDRAVAPNRLGQSRFADRRGGRSSVSVATTSTRGCRRSSKRTSQSPAAGR